jgi:hypothetical protein
MAPAGDNGSGEIRYAKSEGVNIAYRGEQQLKGVPGEWALYSVA